MKSFASACVAAAVLASASFTSAIALPANGSTISAPDANLVQVKMTHKKKMKKSTMSKPSTDAKPADTSGKSM